MNMSKLDIIGFYFRNSRYLSKLKVLLFPLISRLWPSKHLTMLLSYGIRIVYRVRDIGTIYKIFDVGIYNHINDDKRVANGVILDIGAHIGASAIFFAKKFPNSKVYAFEPFSENSELLKRNIEMNGCRNVLPLQEAVLDKNGYCNLNIIGTASHSIVRSENGNVVKIKTCTLEKFENKIDLIKMNVEGVEYNIIKTNIGIIKKTKPELLIQLHPFILTANQIAEIKETLKDAGYRLETVYSENDEEFVHAF